MGNAETAIEVKLSEQVQQQDLKGLIGFCEEHPSLKPIVVSRDKRPRQLNLNNKITILILPWEIFLQKLWQGDI